MQRHLYLCLFLFGLLALVSLVDSYVVLSPQDVSRLGREVHEQQVPPQVESNYVKPHGAIQTKGSPFTFQEDGLEDAKEGGHGMLVRIALGGGRAAKSTFERKPSASHFSLVRIVRSEPFILAHDEVSANRESADVTAAEIPSSSHRSLRVQHVLSRMSHALKELISNDPLTQTVTDKAEDLVAIQTRRMASKPIMRRSRPFNSEMHDEASEEIQNAISFDQNEVDQKLYRYREKDINQNVKTEADMTDLGEDVESVSDVAPAPTVGTTLRPIREEDETEPDQQPEKENDFRHHGHHHHREKDGERHHDSWYRRMDACQSDISKFCGLRPTYSNHDFGAVECLTQQKSRLSSQCIEALSSSTIFQCAADARAFCAESLFRNDKFRHEYQKHRIINCLESKVQVLSANCLTAINNRRSRHGKEPILPSADFPDYSEGDDYSSVAPPSDPKPPRHASSENESSHGGKGLKWAVIPIVGLSAALVFTAILAVVILVQRKRRRQQQAVLEAANSLNIPPPPIDIVAARTIRVTEEVSMAPMAMPYYRMDDAQAV